MISKHDDYFDTTALIGRVAIATIRNQRSHSGFIFSNVDHFEVLSEIDEEIVIEMLKVMLKVYDENHE